MAAIVTIYGLLAVALIASLAKSREKTKQAFIIGGRALVKTGPSILVVLGIVGLTLGILPAETITRLVGAEAGFTATLFAAMLGGVTLIPCMVAFPLAASLLRSGASVMTISAFITSLVMVGLVTAPMEIKYLGKKFTVLRNAFGFVAALLIAFAMEALL